MRISMLLFAGFVTWIGAPSPSGAEQPFGPMDAVSLAQRAAEEKLSADLIKRSVKQWRADLYRV